MPHVSDAVITTRMPRPASEFRHRTLHRSNSLERRNNEDTTRAGPDVAHTPLSGSLLQVDSKAQAQYKSVPLKAEVTNWFPMNNVEAIPGRYLPLNRKGTYMIRGSRSGPRRFYDEKQWREVNHRYVTRNVLCVYQFLLASIVTVNKQ